MRFSKSFYIICNEIWQKIRNMKKVTETCITELILIAAIIFIAGHSVIVAAYRFFRVLSNEPSVIFLLRRVAPY